MVQLKKVKTRETTDRGRTENQSLKWTESS